MHSAAPFLLAVTLVLMSKVILTTGAHLPPEYREACYPVIVEPELALLPIPESGDISPPLDIYDQSKYQNGDYLLVRKTLATTRSSPEGDLRVEETDGSGSSAVSICRTLTCFISLVIIFDLCSVFS